jgi:hypothetical protein
MRTDKSSQPIDPLEILPRLNWAESDEGQWLAITGA